MCVCFDLCVLFKHFIVVILISRLYIKQSICDAYETVRILSLYIQKEKENIQWNKSKSLIISDDRWRSNLLNRIKLNALYHNIIQIKCFRSNHFQSSISIKFGAHGLPGWKECFPLKLLTLTPVWNSSQWIRVGIFLFIR